MVELYPITGPEFAGRLRATADELRPGVANDAVGAPQLIPLIRTEMRRRWVYEPMQGAVSGGRGTSSGGTGSLARAATFK